MVSIITLLSVVLTAAVEERMINFNPCQNLRLGTAHATRKRRPIPMEQQILPIAARARQLSGRRAEIMIITAAFTGMRWGEITGLSRANCKTEDSRILVDPDVGALHETGSMMWLGKPKSRASVRRVDLPPFLVTLLEEVLAEHDHAQVFASTEGEWHRRSNFSRRVWRPAVDGDTRHKPIAPGTAFHGLRHLHKSILIEATCRGCSSSTGSATSWGRRRHLQPRHRTHASQADG